jgi:CHRD domain
MGRRLIVVLALLGLVAAAAIPAIAAIDGPETNAKVLTATLTGDGEATHVDSDGVGVATVTIDRRKKVLCYDISLTGIKPTLFHIHEGAAGVNGPVVVDFTTFGQDVRKQSRGCTRHVAKGLLRDIQANPENFYVNVHTAANPGGELRGQLDK